MGKKKTRKIENSQVAVPPPGVGYQFSILNKNKSTNETFSFARRQLGQIYYDMYKQHPVVRAAIERKSAVAVSGGWSFVGPTPDVKPDPSHVKFLQEFLRRSNGKELMRLTYKQLDIYGESFWLVIRGSDTARTPIKAMALNPRFMEAITNNGMLVSWEYGPVSGDSKAIKYGLDEILHYKLDDPEDVLRGLSPLHSLQRAVAQDIFAMEFNESFFKNSAQTGIVFIVKTSTADEATRNRAWLEENYSGPENAHRPLLIEGDVDVKPSVAKYAEMEFLQGRKLLRQEILMVLEMDPDKVGVHEDSNRSVSKEMEEAFHSQTIAPRQVIVEEEFNNAFILNMLGWDDVLIDHQEGDPRQAMRDTEIYDKNVNGGRMSVNDARKAQGQEGVPGGDESFIMTPQGPLFINAFSEMAKEQIKNGGPVTGGAQKPIPTPKQSTDKAASVKANEPK